MTAAQFTANLKARGFVYDTGSNRWHGPFGLSAAGESPDPVDRDQLSLAYARVRVLQVLDDTIAKRRGVPPSGNRQPAPF